MNFVYELLRAGTTQANSDSGSEVARKINDNFKNVQDKFTELDKTIQEGVTVNVPIGKMMAITSFLTVTFKNIRR